MVVEHLVIPVPPVAQARFLALDAAIWTAVLAAQPGFLGKEVWADPAAPDRLHLIIRWTDRAAWKAVPADLLAATDLRFAAALGLNLPVASCTGYDVVEPGR
jgi:uncharacterized protein (TIGR03792 family)